MVGTGKDINCRYNRSSLWLEIFKDNEKTRYEIKTKFKVMHAVCLCIDMFAIISDAMLVLSHTSCYW